MSVIIAVILICSLTLGNPGTKVMLSIVGFIPSARYVYIPDMFVLPDKSDALMKYVTLPVTFLGGIIALKPLLPDAYSSELTISTSPSVEEDQLVPVTSEDGGQIPRPTVLPLPIVRAATNTLPSFQSMTLSEPATTVVLAAL